MTESVLQSLMKLFAILATINIETTNIFSRNFVESFLKGQFSPRIVEKSIKKFDQYLEELASVRKQESNKRISILSVKILIICNEINNQLPLQNKFLILFSIIQFDKYFEANTKNKEEYRSTILDAVDTIAEALLINESEYRNCSAFIKDRFFRVPDRSSLLIVNSMERFHFKDIKHIYKQGLSGQFFFLKIHQAEMYIFYYSGTDMLDLGGKSVFPNHVYILPKGGAIKSETIDPLYYGDIANALRRDADFPKIQYTAENIEFSYPGSENGIHEMNLGFNAGEMIGVMGGSGTGKSTLMGLLNGTIEPDSGDVKINGFAVNAENEGLKGLMGFVPQDDLLIEELSVFDNLYYNAELCLGNLSKNEIIKRIDKVLNSLGLFYIKNLKVGNVLNKYISGGQRKRLNIALELIREPYILFVDEPTSGLSSTDSENVLTLLKEQALSGKIIVINIHQPSSEIFKLFDKIIIMDVGGYPVYFGNPLDSVQYLKNVAKRADADEIQCEVCGNVQTDDILKIIEAKKLNEIGEYTKERIMSPEEWYELYRENIDQQVSPLKKEKLPPLNYRVPGRLKQFFVYSRRNFFSKIADKQFVGLALSITPILAFILGFFTKYLGGIRGGNPYYVFSLNENLPAYLFMSVVVALFVGMIISAEEIIRDRKIRSREAFLNLNSYSYFNSKILFLFGLSAFQIVVFVLLGNWILEIKGLNFNYWLILFSTSCFAVMLGLNISAGLKSIVSIYIIIPFVLVPLILLSGVIVSYDKLYYKVAGKEFVPIAGDVMASRWAYEALVVNQFKNNDYEKCFFEKEKEEANTLYNLTFLLPEINNIIKDYIESSQSDDKEHTLYYGQMLSDIFKELEGTNRELRRLDPQHANVPLMKSYLKKWKEYLINRSNNLALEKDSLTLDLAEKMGGISNLVQFKQKYHNEAIEDLVLKTNDLKKIVEYQGRIIRKDTPIFQIPRSRFGRAQFFSASKFIGGLEIDTVFFNVLVLWFMTCILYIALVNDWLRKIINIFDRKPRK